MANVLTVVHPASAKWNNIGLALGIVQDELDKISGTSGDADDRLREVLKLWLKGNGGERTRKFLCEALQHPLVGRKDLANCLY